MKNPILRISMFAFLFVLVSFAPPSKVIYASAEGKLMITFPAAYESADMSTEDYTSIQTQANFEDQLFFVTYNIHNSELMDHAALAETSLNAFSEAMSGTITSQNTWKVKKNSGLKARIDIPGLGLVADYGVVLVGQIQYQVAVVSATEQWNQARSDAFFKSFKLKK
jgi:hypothetical protein